MSSPILPEHRKLLRLVARAESTKEGRFGFQDDGWVNLRRSALKDELKTRDVRAQVALAKGLAANGLIEVSERNEQLVRTTELGLQTLEKVAAPVHQVFNAPVGAVQSGNANTAAVTSASPPAALGPAPGDAPGTPRIGLDWSQPAGFLSAEMRMPILWLAVRRVQFELGIRTMKEIPGGLIIKRWKALCSVGGIRVEVPFDVECSTAMREVGVTSLGTASFSLADSLLLGEQPQVASELFFWVDIPGQPREVRLHLMTEFQIPRVSPN